MTRRAARRMRLHLAQQEVPLEEPFAQANMPKEEFLKACLEVLQGMDPQAAKKIKEELKSLKKDPQGKGMYYFLLEDVVEALNEAAPEGYFFGTKPDNHQDFGFWPNSVSQYSEYQARRKRGTRR